MTSVGNITGGNNVMDFVGTITPNVSADTGNFGQYMQKEVAAQNTAATTEYEKTQTVSKEQTVSVTKENTAVVSEPNRMQNTDVSEETVISEEQMASLNQEIQDAVKTVMGIDDETMENILAEMGIMPVELLQPENLQQFILRADGGQELTDLLMNEDMMADFTLVSDVLQSMDLTETMQVSMEQLLQQMDMAEGIPGENFAVPENMAAMAEPELAEEPVKQDPTVVVTIQQDDSVSRTGNQTNEETVGMMTDPETSTAADNMLETESQTMADANASGQSEQNLPEQADVIQREPTAEFAVNGNVQQPLQSEAAGEVTVPQSTPQMVQIVEQIVEQIRINLQADTTTMEMQLNPESLGKVLLTVSDKAGLMTANFTVQTEEARLALESQMLTLRDSLEQKELKVDAVEVTVSNFELTQGDGSKDDQKNLDQGDGRSRRFHVESAEEEDDEAVSAESEAERVRRSVMRDNGSSIDFTA